MFRSFARPFAASGRAFARQAALPASFLLCALPAGISTAWAQTDAAPEGAGRLQTVVVTGTRTPLRVDQNIADVSVIDRAQIEQATGRTLPELLAQQPGVQFSSNGGLGQSSSVFLRGLESRHTLLLIDGVRYGSATLGMPTWENLPLEAIERIEIVRGPASGLYGTDAVGGVVQIFTRRGADGLRFDASATAGSNRYGQLGAGVRFGQGDFDGSVQVQHTGTRGFSATNERAGFNFNPDRDGFRQNSGTLQLGWRIGGGWRLDTRALRSDGVTRFDEGPGVDSRAALRSEVLSMALGGPVTATWRSSLRVARSTDNYETLETAFPPPGTFRTVQQQITFENIVATPLGTALLLAEHLEQKVSKSDDPYDVSQRTINSIGTGLNGNAGIHSWQGSLRHDRNSQFGPQTTGTLGYGLALSPAWRAAASYGTSFVAPSFNQLYFPGFGNPNLLPEEGRHSEVSLRWAEAGQQVRAAYFDNRIRGYISNGPAPANIPRARIDGFGLSYQAQLRDWTLAASADHMNPRNDTEGTAAFGKQLLRRARNSVKALADWTQGDWRFGGTLTAFGERYDDRFNDDFSVTTVRLPAYATVDLRTDWRLARDWRLGLRLNNIANRAYETAYGYNQPGREVYVTLRYNGS